MILDSNIIIYAARPEYAFLREFIIKNSPSVSDVSYVEVLGYHRLTESDKEQFELFFTATTMLPLSTAVLKQAAKIRQLRKITLGDALIAGTALVHNLTLVTRNEKDFRWITGLSILNPFDNEQITAV